MLNLDGKTARDLLKTVPRMKPIGVARVYYPGVAFEFEGQPYEETDALVLTPSGVVTVLEKPLIDTLFEPVAKRTSPGRRSAREAT